MRQLSLEEIKEVILLDGKASNNDLACDLVSRFFQLAWTKEKEGRKDIADIYERRALALFDKLEEVGYYTTGEEVEA